MDSSDACNTGRMAIRPYAYSGGAIVRSEELKAKAREVVADSRNRRHAAILLRALQKKTAKK